MSIDSIFTGYEIAVVLSVTIAACTILWWLAGRSRRRHKDLLAVKTALAAHYEAMDAILDDPALPDRPRLLISQLTLAISDKELSEWIAYSCMDGTLFNKKPRQDPFAADMAELQKTRPDLVRNFDRAMNTGIVALMLRWPSSAAMFHMMAAMLASDDRRKFEVANNMVLHNERAHSRASKNDRMAAAGAC